MEQDLSMTYVIILCVQEIVHTRGTAGATETAEEAVNHADERPLKPVFLFAFLVAESAKRRRRKCRKTNSTLLT